MTLYNNGWVFFFLQASEKSIAFIVDQYYIVPAIGKSMINPESEKPEIYYHQYFRQYTITRDWSRLLNSQLTPLPASAKL